MLNKFKEKFKFSSKYFETLLENSDKFPQSIVFEGLDIYGQYFFALELARILNCKEKGDDDCNCINCSWIRENKHPQVITVTPVDFKPQGDESKTVISVKQTREIIKSLSQKSDYHRVFIFLDAKEGQLDEHSKKMLASYNSIGFKLPREDWVIEGLSRKVFDDEAPNSLLKSIEEPPLRTTFIFLTKNREDLINTIVSRSFIFKLPSEGFEFDYSKIKNLFSNYPNITLKEALFMTEEILKYADENDVSPSDILNMTEELIGGYLISNPKNTKIKKDLRKVTEARKMLEASIRAKTVFEYLFIGFSL